MGLAWGRSVGRGGRCNLLFFMSCRMSDLGAIHVPFITARMPSWAGVRQGLSGTTINGDPFSTANGVLTSPYVEQAAAGTSAVSRSARSMPVSATPTAAYPVLHTEALNAIPGQLTNLFTVVLNGIRGHEEQLEDITTELQRLQETTEELRQLLTSAPAATGAPASDTMSNEIPTS